MDEHTTLALTPSDHAIILHEGTALEGYRIGDQWYVVMRRVCREFGLDWEGQRQRIMRDPILSEGACMIQAPSGGGEQATLGLRGDLFWGWLFKLELSRLNADVKRVLTPIQRAGYQALHDHFTARPAVAAPALDGPTLESLSAQLTSLQHELARLKRPASLDQSRTLHVTAQAILDIVGASAIPLMPGHVERALLQAGHAIHGRNYVRVRMTRLMHAGLLIKVGHGLYAAAAQESGDA